MQIDGRLWPLLIGVIILASVLLGLFTDSVEAAPSAQEVTNDTCLSCHSNESMVKTFPSGEELSLFISGSKFRVAVHGQEGLNCVDCHATMAQIPHPEFAVQTIRDAKFELYTVCQNCHLDLYNSVLDSVHQKALAAGIENAAICTDCHNPHTQTRITDVDTDMILPEARLFIPETCARCHSAIYDEYKETIHGAALVEEGNLDVPTCIDCHGVHNIQDPTTAQFRNETPLLCARCHTDPEVMDKYGLSTNVLNSYVADFHGTTVTLFEKTDPNLPTNKAVCTDCHGIHDIKAVDDPEVGIALKENMLVKCQRCHPDATVNFPDSWMSHYDASPENFPLVYYVNLFYKILIPGVLGGMTLYVLTDIYRRFIAHKKEGAH
jgi:hypothetical protein